MPCKHTDGPPCAKCSKVILPLGRGVSCQQCGDSGLGSTSNAPDPGLFGKRYTCGFCLEGQRQRKIASLPPFPIMVDSGAYSAWTLGVEIDIDAYIAFLHDFKKDFPQAVLIALDVIGNERKSYENWRIMQKAGLETVPVFHPLPDFEWDILYKYLDHCRYIAIGGSSEAPKTLRHLAFSRTWERLVDSRGFPVVKVHGMGVSGFSDMRKYPWYSVDSSSWMRPGTFGMVTVPPRRNGEWDFYSNPLKIHVDQQEGFVVKPGKLTLAGLSIPEREMLLSYFRELRIPLGFYSLDEEGHRLKIKGVTNHLKYRCMVGIEYLARLTAHLPWPRPLEKKKFAGFFEEEVPHRKPVIWTRRPFPCTTYYLSGTPYRLETGYVLPRRDSMPHMGVLNSYYYLQKSREIPQWKDLEILRNAPSPANTILL